MQVQLEENLLATSEATAVMELLRLLLARPSCLAVVAVAVGILETSVMVVQRELAEAVSVDTQVAERVLAQRTPGVAVAEFIAGIPPVLVAQGSSWYGRLSVALLRVS